jgi:hypothetical protein
MWECWEDEENRQPYEACSKKISSQFQSIIVDKCFPNVTIWAMAERKENRLSTLTWQEVQKMVGLERFFGQEDVNKHYGDKLNISTDTPLPTWWRRDVIDGPCPFYANKKFSETHFVYFTFPTTIQELIELHPGNMHYKEGTHPKIDALWLAGEFENQTYHYKKSVPGWHTLLIGAVPTTQVVTIPEINELIGNDYELSFAVDRVTANIFYYHLNNEYLDKKLLVHCQDWDTSEFPSGSSVVVGAADLPGSGNGIWIGHSNINYADQYTRISASRKF